MGMGEQVFYTVAARFEAARRLDWLPNEHRMANLHGHSFVARVRAPSSAVSSATDHVHELGQELATAVAPLDYVDLNRVVDRPTDANLASWLRGRLRLAGGALVEVQGAERAGGIVADDHCPRIWRRFTLESAHQLPRVPSDHKCGRMHGHTFQVILHADQRADSREGEYGYLDDAWMPLQAELHCACLNDIHGLDNPTSELLASWTWARLKPSLPELRSVTVLETAGSGAQYDGSRYQIWKEMSFDSALQLQRAPVGDARRSIHGHTYKLRLYLSAPLDEVMGWVIDFGDVKKVFKPTLDMLDHRHLNEVLCESDPGTESVARWIKKQVQVELPQLNGIGVSEVSGCGTLLFWSKEPRELVAPDSWAAGMSSWG